MKNLEKRVEAIEQRNQKVELDKKWETSWTRRLSITGLTYLVIVTYLFVIGSDRPFFNGVVPSGGFLLSTLLLKRIRTIWQKNQ